MAVIRDKFISKIMLKEMAETVLKILTLGLFRKKLFCIWFRKDGKWENLNPAGNSKRSCRQAVSEMISMYELSDDRFLILPKNVFPPSIYKS